jgi:hypothetical protein
MEGQMTDRSLKSVSIRHAALSNSIVLARFGKDPTLALETRNAMSEFWQALASYAFDGRMPEVGSSVEVKFGGGDQQFALVISRIAALDKPSPGMVEGQRK